MNSASDQNPKNEVEENSEIEDTRSPYKNEVSSHENEITEVRDDDKRFRNGIGKERGACSMWAITHDEGIRVADGRTEDETETSGEIRARTTFEREKRKAGLNTLEPTYVRTE